MQPAADKGSITPGLDPSTTANTPPLRMRTHLHSSLPQTRWNFQSETPTLTLRCDSSAQAVLSAANHVQKTWQDPLAALEWMSRNFGNHSSSRWIGYLSYDLGRLLEPMSVLAKDDLHLPLFCFSLHEESQAGERCCEPHETTLDTMLGPRSDVLKNRYLSQIEKAIEYIRAGDVFQVNLSQRFTTPLMLEPEQIWRNLVARFPASYGAFLDCGDHVILSNSPELFLRIDPDRTITTRPIKGTRPRGPGMADELLNSTKDQAELNMIVDLERNDLGRICRTGSVVVSQPRTIEEHPTVYHGVATIQGKLRDNIGFVDILRATFPGGSITGAPKIRAMQIIEELEPVRRGPYCGAIGYLAADGSMQFNVAIRTMIVQDKAIYIPVGGGIVADSNPIEEYEETLVKAAAMFGSLNQNPERSGTPRS